MPADPTTGTGGTGYRSTMTRPEAAAVLQAFHSGKEEVLARLEGLTDREYRWEPVEGCWSVRPVGSDFVADFVPEADPAPFTTIAWRIWHIAADCLDSYSRRAFDRPGPRDEAHFVGGATDAVADLDRAVDNFLSGLSALGEDVWQPIGPEFGPFAEASFVDLALHAHREVVHHGAEIGLLRDLYRATPRTA